MKKQDIAIGMMLCLGTAGSGAPQKAGSAAARTRASAAAQTTSKDPFAPAADQARALAYAAIDKQHDDDAALEQYERTERQVTHRTASPASAIEDRTSRIVPTGTGTLKLLLKDRGKLVDSATQMQNLRAWIAALEDSLRSNDPAMKPVFDKAEKRRRDRHDLLEAMKQAFHAKWLGREMVDGQMADKIGLDPNPDFHPQNTQEEVLTHVRATIWIDEHSMQMVRGEAEVIRDIGFGGGILGKVYRGGHFYMEQKEVAPGVWLPSYYQYDFAGRKFLFGFEAHQSVETSQYRKLGTAQQALQIAKQELAGRQSGSIADP
jgi:hypothetical protein